jgi:hypothetical protein
MEKPDDSNWSQKLTDAINVLFEIQNRAITDNASEKYKLAIAEAIADLLVVRRGL